MQAMITEQTCCKERPGFRIKECHFRWMLRKASSHESCWEGGNPREGVVFCFFFVFFYSSRVALLGVGWCYKLNNFHTQIIESITFLQVFRQRLQRDQLKTLLLGALHRAGFGFSGHKGLFPTPSFQMINTVYCFLRAVSFITVCLKSFLICILLGVLLGRVCEIE